MMGFVWVLVGFVLATVFWAVVLGFIAAGCCIPLLPFFMMSHSTPSSMDAYKKEHPWMYRWWAFVAWLADK